MQHRQTYDTRDALCRIVSKNKENIFLTIKPYNMSLIKQKLLAAGYNFFVPTGPDEDGKIYYLTYKLLDDYFKGASIKDVITIRSEMGEEVIQEFEDNQCYLFTNFEFVGNTNKIGKRYLKLIYKP